MKLLTLSDLHVGISRQSSTHPGVIRQANSQSLESLKLLIPKFNQMKFDAVIQLGDLVRDVDSISDKNELSKSLKLLSELNAPVINLVGNHDIKNVTKDELAQICTNTNTSSDYFGVKTYGNTQIIWLDFEVAGSEVYLPSHQLNIIQKHLIAHSNKIIFSHHALISKNTIGNFYFDKNENETRYSNLNEIQSFLSKNSIKLVISGHEHWIGIKEHDDVYHVTLPSFCENITTSANPNMCPGVYTIVDVENNKIDINSYSGDYSFFHFEI